MNRIYCVVWNAAAGLWQVAGEFARRRGKRASGRSKSLPIAVSSLLLMPLSVLAGALPTGGNVVAGRGEIAQSGTELTITQDSQQLAIDWQSFSIDEGHTVTFIQPGADAAALNRVLGPEVSKILGSLQANGHVFLINPNGVLFGEHAQVEAGGLVASTLDITTENFMAGDYRFEGDSANAVVNRGSLRAVEGGYVALIAARIENVGTITADNGDVLLGAGRKVRLDLGGPVKLEVEEGALNALIEQGGAIRADGGRVFLTARAAGDLASTVINHSGVTQARSLATGENGEIVLLGEGGDVTVAGTLDVSAPEAGGGKAVVTGERVLIADGARIDATGATGGGEIYVGGGWQGEDPAIKEATATVIASGATLDASATDHGDGGTIVAWSDVGNADSVTRAYGTLRARGGADGGDGGRIETSGYELEVGQAPDVGAPAGEGGEWLIDPHDIDIVAGGGSTNMTAANPFESTGGSATIGVDLIRTGLSTGDVIVRTGASGFQPGDITWQPGVTLDYDGIGIGRTLTLQAHGSILYSGSITDGILGGDSLNVVFDAGGGLLAFTGSVITTNGGAFSATMDSIGSWSSVAGDISTGAGDLSLTMLGDAILGFSGANLNTTTGNLAITVGTNNPGGASKIEAIDGTAFTTVAGAISLTDTDGNGWIVLGGGTGGVLVEATGTGTITVDSASGFLLRNGSTIQANGGLVTLAGKGIQIGDAGVGSVLNPTGTVILDSTQNSTNTGADDTLRAANLLLTGTGDVSLLNGTIDVDTLAANVDGAVSIADADEFTVGSVALTNGINVSGNLALYTGGNLSIAQAIATTAGTVDLDASGSIALATGGSIATQGSAVTLSAGGAFTTATGTTITTNGGAFAATMTTWNNDISGDISTGAGNLSLNAVGDTHLLFHGAALDTTTGDVSITVGGNNPGGGGKLELYDGTTISTVDGDISLRQTDGVGWIGLSNTLIQATGAGTATVDSADGVYVRDNSTIQANGGAVTLRGRLIQIGDIGLGSVLNPTGTVILDGLGNLTKSGADDTLQASNLLLTGTSDVDLLSGSIDVDTLAANVEGAVSLADLDEFIVGSVALTNGINVSGNLALSTGGSILIAQAIATTAGTVDLDASGNIALAPGGSITTQGTAVTLDATGGFSSTADTTVTTNGGAFSATMHGWGNDLWGDISTGAGNLTLDVVGDSKLLLQGAGLSTTTGNLFISIGANNPGGGSKLEMYSGTTLSTVDGDINVTLTDGIGWIGFSDTVLQATGTAGTVTVDSANDIYIRDNSTMQANGGLLTLRGALIQIGDLGLGSVLNPTGTVVLDGLGKLTQSGADDTLEAASLLISGTNDVDLLNGSLDVGTLAAQVTGTLSYRDAGALTIGSVAGVDGVTVTGPVLLETVAGDLVVNQSVGTSATSADALVLNAGVAQTVGQADYDVRLGSGLSLSVGTGGRATLYTGSLAGSTGAVAAAGGAGSGHFRYHSDESTTNYTAALGAGTYAIYREQPTLVVSPDAGAQSQYGDALVSLSGRAYTVSGQVNGDTVALGGAASFTTDATATSNAGGYDIAYSGGLTNALGYAIQDQAAGGEYTITPRVLDLTGSRVYDGTSNLAAGIFTLENLVAGETLTLGGAGTMADKHVGDDKSVTVGTLVLDDGTGLASNYTLASGSHLVDITTAALTISAADVVRTYDGTTAAAGAAIVAGGTLFGDDNLGGGDFAFTNPNAGMGQTVTVTNVTVNDDNGGNNYVVTYADNTTSTIERANLTITADDQAALYGGEVYDGGFTASYGGFVNGEDASVLGGALAFGGDSQDAVLPGSYTISASGLQSQNYAIDWVDGMLTIARQARNARAEAAAAQAIVAPAVRIASRCVAGSDVGPAGSGTCGRGGLEFVDAAAQAHVGRVRAHGQVPVIVTAGGINMPPDEER